MYKMKHYLLAGALVLTSHGLFAQTATSGTIEKTCDVNFTELANYYKAHPTPLVRKPMFDEDGDKDGHPVHITDPSKIRLINRPEAARSAETPHTAFLPVSPAPTDTFLASTSDGTSIPPDTHGAVDSTYCVTAINDAIVIRTRAGALVSSVTLDNFWTSLETHGTGAYDPRVHYDPNFKRWIMVTDCYGETTYSTIFIAVSATGDPTGTWHMYKLLVGGSSGTWLDFPCVGFNNKWVAVSGNFFTSAGSFTNDVIYTFNYANLMAGTTLAYNTLLPTGGSFCVAPALTYDATEPNLYCMESWNGTAGQLQLWKISGAVGSPVITAVANPSTTTHWQGQGAGGADFAPQLGSTDKLQTNDDRINNLMQRNGKLWCAHTAFLPATGTVKRASAMWWEVDTTGTPVQNGMVNDPTNSIFYAFPSITANINGDALMGFAYLSSAVHPSAAYALHMHTDPNDSMRPVDIFRHGQKTYYQTFGGSDDRWGDYSGTCIDPRNNTDFWTIQESVPNYSGGIGSSLWDTWWAYVQVCPTLAAPLTGTFATTQCTATAATYSVATVTGATGYTWTVAGTGWSGTSTTNSISLTAGTGTATVSVAANNSCGAGTAYTFTVAAISVPTAPTITATSPACVGTSTAGFAATGTSGTSFTWTVSGTGWAGSSTTGSVTATVGAGTGTIMATATNACGTGPAGTLTVTPSTVPAAATAITPPTTICSGSTITLTEPVVTGATSYTWTITGTGWSGTSTTNSITATVGTGTASIIVTPLNACGSGTPYSLGSVVPVITPTAAYTVVNHVTPINTTDVFTYTGTAASGATYTWNFAGGVATPGGTTAGPQTVTWATGGLKTITLTVTNAGCTSATYTDTVLVFDNTGVTALTGEHFSMSVLPNPNDGNFEILFDKGINKTISVKLFDMQGRIVYRNEFSSTMNNKLKIATDNLPSGTYTVSVIVEGVVSVNKITISR